MRAADDLLAAAGQVAFVVEVGDLLARGVDLGVLHLRGDVKLVVDPLPHAFVVRQAVQPLLGRLARLDIVPRRTLDAAEHGFDRAHVGRHGALPQLIVGLDELRAEVGHPVVKIVNRQVARALRQRKDRHDGRRERLRRGRRGPRGRRGRAG